MKNILVTFVTSFLVTIIILNAGFFSFAQEERNKNQEPKQIEQQFPDVELDAWFYPYVTELVETGIANGKPDGNFGSWEPVNKAELAKMLVLLRAELRGNWLKDNFLEIILVIATVLGWLTIVNRMPKTVIQQSPSSENNTQARKPSQKNEKSSQSFSLPDLKEGVPPPKSLQDKKAASTIEKNLKSNWWT